MIPTGFGAFDTLTGGLVPGGITLIAGNPGVGVTNLCRSIALAVPLLSDQPVIWMPAPSGRPEVLQLARAITGRVRPTDLGDLTRAQLVVQPTAGCSLADVVGVCRLVGPGVLVIDDLTALGSTSDVLADLRAVASGAGTRVVVGLRLDREVDELEPEARLLTTAGVDLAHVSCALVLEREDQQDPTSPRAGELDVWRVWPKRRTRRLGIMAHQPHLARVVDIGPGNPFDRRRRRHEAIELLRSWQASSADGSGDVVAAGDGLAEMVQLMLDITTTDICTED